MAVKRLHNKKNYFDDFHGASMLCDDVALNVSNPLNKLALKSKT